jgi:hypothetical protein
MSPFQALQMINNFIQNATSYDTLLDVDLTPAALSANYTSPPMAPCSRKFLDKITDLPGLTFPISFAQYSGYLKASDTNYLHYWSVVCVGVSVCLFQVRRESG